MEVDNTLLPCDNSETQIKFLFKCKTLQDEREIEKRSYVVSKRPDNIDSSGVDYQLYRRLSLRRCLYAIGSWFPERSNNWIREDDWNKILGMSAPIINSALFLFDISSSLGADDEALIERQSVGLYAAQNGSVTNPHPVVSSYCSTASLWDKIGLGVSSPDDVLVKDYMGFRIITGAESDAMRRASQKH